MTSRNPVPQHSSTRDRKLTLLLTAACLLTTLLPGNKAHGETLAGQNAPRIVEHVDDSRVIAVQGNVRPEANAKNDRGPVSTALQMGDLVLVLRRSPAQQTAFEAFLASQQDHSSPNFHQWLTPDQIGQKFGPAQADLDAITQWLQNHNLAVTYVSKDRLSIRFGGTAANVQSTFHTDIHNLEVQVRGNDGQMRLENHIANMTAPKIPEALTPVVVGVAALHNFFPRPLHKLGSVVRRNSSAGKWERIASPTQPAVKATEAGTKTTKRVLLPQFGTGGTTSGAANYEDISPYDFATIYNVLPLWTASNPINGAGQSIAIAGTSNINLADVTTFRTAFGLPTTGTYKSPKVIVTNTDPGDCSNADASCINDLYENSLDVEWSGAVATNAQIILVVSAATTPTTDNLLLSEQYIVDNVTAKIMNVSYGECELGLSTENSLYNTLWSTAQAAGIAVFTASGDSGSASCDAGGDNGGSSVPYGAQYGLSVSGLASTPYDTAVGGTDLNWDADQSKYWATSNNTANNSSALGYIPETPWNDTCSNPVLVAQINKQLGESYTAAQICDDLGNGTITDSNGGSLAVFVDTIGGSGGKSNCIDGDGANVSSCTKGYPKPSWQAGVTGIPADNARDIPDVSFFASNGFFGSAYVVCVSAAGTCSYTAGTEPIGEEIGGTSVSSPIMAGVMALINQKTASSQGSPNSELYQLAAAESYSGCSAESIPLTGSACAFNDIDTGTIAMACVLGSPDCTGSNVTNFGILSGYSAGVGFDLASGLGSLNVTNLVNAYYTAVSPSFTLTTPALTVTPGTAGSETVTVHVANGYTGTVNLTCTVTTLTGGIDTPTCTGGSATVTSSGGTGTLTINTTAPTSSFRKALSIATNSNHSTAMPTTGKTLAAASGMGAIAIAGILLFGIPARSKKWRSMLALILTIASLGILSGCSGGGGSGSKGGTTAGTYTVTVTGTDSATSTITATQTFTLTVN